MLHYGSYHKISISSACVFKIKICSLRFSARFIRDILALVSNDRFFSRGMMNDIGFMLSSEVDTVSVSATLASYQIQ